MTFSNKSFSVNIIFIKVNENIDGILIIKSPPLFNILNIIFKFVIKYKSFSHLFKTIILIPLVPLGILIFFLVVSIFETLSLLPPIIFLRYAINYSSIIPSISFITQILIILLLLTNEN